MRVENKYIFVVGPTASGKSSWALNSALKYNGSIINIDSVQCYKGLTVGSAAPSIHELSLVPHHLYNYVEAPNELTAGQYLRDFYHLIENPPENLRFPVFIVGGTGFYIQALEKGMYDVDPIPEPVRKALEHELESKGAEILYQELLKSDPETKVHLNDHYRIVRALEIIRYFGKTPTQLNSEFGNKNQFKFPYIKIGFDFSKNEYLEKVSFRTEKMIQNGIIEEVQIHVDNGFADWAALQSVGYFETLNAIRNGIDRAKLAEAINQSTMKLIKKQKTWFKRDKSILWSNHDSELLRFLS